MTPRRLAAYRQAEGYEAAQTAQAVLGILGLALATVLGAGVIVWLGCELLEAWGWL